MLEAMARGCVPVVARVASGAAQAIEQGVNGLIADVDTDASEAEVGAALAAGVSALLESDMNTMSRAAWRSVADRFSIERHAERVGALLDEIASAPARPWPHDRPLAFDLAGGSIGPGGAELLGSLLETLRGRRIAIHGVGAHTRHLWPVFAGAPVHLVALTDDDRALHATTRHGLRIVSPDQVGASGATDVVISSWMHEDDIWQRRAVYEQAGLRVHRIYRSTRSNGSRYTRSHASFSDARV
jgi:hypothetical protein